MRRKFLSEKLKGRNQAEDLGIDGKVMLEWNSVGRCGLD
jgi:hypothetical protein